MEQSMLFYRGQDGALFMSQHLTFGFWLGTLLNDPEEIVEGTGKKMRRVKIFKKRRPEK